MRVSGECNGCGDCCRLIVLLDRAPWPDILLKDGRVPTAAVVTSKDVAHWLAVRGARIRARATKIPLDPVAEPFWRGTYAEKPAWFFASTCPQVTVLGQCKLHGTPLKPASCVRFPAKTDSLECLPRCSYSIK